MRHAQVEQRQFKELVAKVRNRYQISMRESVERSHSPQASAWVMAALSTRNRFTVYLECMIRTQ